MSVSGEQVRLTTRDYTAVVVQVGAALRSLRHHDRDLVVPFAEDEVRPRFRGAVLVPWPNRVADGAYYAGGVRHQLPVTEPARGNALHGLVVWSRFEVHDRDERAVTLQHQLVPQDGYPFSLDVAVRYALADDGLTCTVTTLNTGAAPAPYGIGSHPYLVAGPGGVDEWSLRLPAEEVLEVTSDRLLPVRRQPVTGTGFDFADGRLLRGLEVDHAFTGLRPDGDGLVRAQVRCDGGGGVESRWDPGVLPWVQVHTADLGAGATGSRDGLAVEPMTCPPDAFNSGTDLVSLDPGEAHEASWTICALRG